MTELNDNPIYFQWQNDALRKTIYPLRETKLRDFLVYFYEIEVWEGTYSKKELKDIPDEVAVYQESQKEKWEAAIKNYYSLKEYFESSDVIVAFQKVFSQPDDKYLRDINNNVHKRFEVFYSKEQSVRREKNLIIDRVRWLERHRKDLQYELSEEQRRLRNNPNHTRKDEIKQRIDQLEHVTLKMAQLEIQKINDYFNAFVKLEKRRGELDKWQKLKSKEWQEKDKNLKKRKASDVELQRQIAILSRSIQRMGEPNAGEKMRQYLTDDDVLDDYQRFFTEINEGLIASINMAHRWFINYFNKNGKLAQLISRSVLTYTRNWAYKDQVRKQMAEYEIGLMEDFVDVQGKSAEQIASVISQKEDQRKELESELSRRESERQALENELSSLNDKLSLRVDEQLAEFTGFQDVTVRDIARGKVEDYKNLLAPKNGVSMPMVTNDEVSLMMLEKVNAGQAPEPVPVSENGRVRKAALGTKFRVSMMDQVDGFKAEDGLVDVGGSGKYYLVVACPDDRSMVGYYVSDDRVEEIDEKKLLELIVEKFLDDPTGYPLWLQYMVVHFSGMRYQSAHGSWADPRDLLVSLTEKAVLGEVMQASEEAIEILSQEKIDVYEGGNDRDKDQGSDEVIVKPPQLALTKDSEWVEKWRGHIQTLKSTVRRAKVALREETSNIAIFQVIGEGDMTKNTTNTLPADAEFTVGEIFSHEGNKYYRIEEYEDKPELEGHYVLNDDLILLPNPRQRKDLLDLRVDEETYKAEVSDDQQVLADLEKMKDRLALPNWMWNEIVRMTELRLKTKNEKWEAPTAEELASRNAYEAREYRALMIDWKKKNLTGWRAEHDRSSRLIVTRAVCNEVAEHIQHLRGRTPPGGLTAKPEWYLREERNASDSNGMDKPYLVKPKEHKDFTVGASILWLRFVNSEPNAWRIALPLTLKDGSGLLNPQLGFRNWDRKREMRRAPKKKSGASTAWVYSKVSTKYKRHRIVNDAQGAAKPEDQWLRWMHEATVAAVGETADGQVVLTFETALPYEDKRRSTIGVFRHSVNGLKYNVTPNTFVGSFVGYVPYGNIPADELKEMLDWDKVLPENSFSDEIKNNYRLEVDRELSRLSSRGGTTQTNLGGVQAKGSPVEVSISIRSRNHKEWTLGYEIDMVKNRTIIHQPRVEVRRGTRLYVDLENPKNSKLNFRSTDLYRVTRCDLEPRVEGLYIKASQVIEVPEVQEGEQDQASKPVMAGKGINLLTIKGNNQKGLPIFVQYFSKVDGGSEKVQLKAGMPFRVSTVHHIDKKRPSNRQPDRGDGILNGDAKARCYLIVECPGQERAVGLFVPEGAVEAIDEEAYKLKITQPEVEEPQELIVRSTPRKGKTVINLFKPAEDGKKFNRTADTLPENTEFEVDPKPAFAKGKTYYRIVTYPAKTGIEGQYANVKDVTPILRVAAAPKNGEGSISIYKSGLEGEKVISQVNTVPRNVEIVVDPIAVFDHGLGYYRILEYPEDTSLNGHFVKYEDVSNWVEIAELSGGSDNGAAAHLHPVADSPKSSRLSLPEE